MDIARRLARRRIDVVLAIGGFHERGAVLRAMRAVPHRPPIVAWVGDSFDEAAAPVAELYDLVGHTDSALLARHRAFGFASPAIFLPHAADPSRRRPRVPRSDRMVFIGAASPEREAVLACVREPVDVRGPGWRRKPTSPHHMQARRVPHAATARLYAGALAALNLRNPRNVVAGLNQRNFDPYLFGAPVVSDAQPDLERCFEPGVETLVWRDAVDLNGQYARLRRDPGAAARIAEAGLKRIQAEHTFSHRLRSILRAL